MRRILPLLCALALPLRAEAVETLRIAMDEVEGALDVTANSLSFGRDDEEGDFTALPSRAHIQLSSGGLRVNGAAWAHDAVRFHDGGREPGGSIRAGKFSVRGDLVVRAHANRLQLINVLPLENY